VRCSRCGNENPATNRFCGMCGATLLPEAPPAETAPARAAAPVIPATPVPPPAPQPTARVTEPPLEEEEPAISGPSFLGLNQPRPRQSASAERRQGSLSIDPNSAPASRDLDYLLEDEGPRHGGGWKVAAIFLALALAVGMGYLRWRNQGFGWLNSSAEKHAAAPSSDDSTAAPSTSAGQTPDSSAGPVTGAAPTTNPATPGDASAANPANQKTNPAPAASSAPDSATAPAGSNAPATQTAANPPSANPNPPSDAAPQPEAKQPAATSPAAQPAGKAAASDDSTSSAEHAKPSAASETPRPVKTADPVAEAQKYLYGKGVPQNCDRGLRLLKPAAEHANPKAMIEMGALYSAGLCTPRDLPTAYRWFAMALRKEPDNDSVQADLKKLWGEMTQPERQLAIKLSQ
jgi:hypothetical protein